MTSLKSDLANNTAFTHAEVAAASVTTPPAGKQKTFIDSADHILKRKDSAGTVKTIEGGDMSNPMTTVGDVIYGGASGLPTRLAVGTAGQQLQVNAGATAPAWVTVPGARVYNSTAQSTTSGTPLLLAFNSERWDTDTIHDTVTNNSRLTCKTAGKYMVTGNIEFASNATGYRSTFIMLNDTKYIAVQNAGAINGAVHSLVVSTIIDMVVNDFVTLYASQSSGGALNVNASDNTVSFYVCEFMMQRIG